MRENERLYEMIEEAVKTKNRIRIDMQKGDTLRLIMVNDTKFLVEDLYWMDERRNVYRAVLEAGFEKQKGFVFSGMYVYGNQMLDGFHSGRTTMFRKENRYHTNF